MRFAVLSDHTYLATHKTIPLKGQCYEIFDFRFFSWIGSPIRAVSNFFETLQRYSQLKVHRCRWHLWQICYRCHWYRWCTLTCEYLPEFSKNSKWPLCYFQGPKQKISWHCSFKIKNAHFALDCLKYCSIKVKNWLCHPGGKYLIEKLSVLPPSGHLFI